MAATKLRVLAPTGIHTGPLRCKQGAAAHHWPCTGRAGAPQAAPAIPGAGLAPSCLDHVTTLSLAAVFSWGRCPFSCLTLPRKISRQGGSPVPQCQPCPEGMPCSGTLMAPRARPIKRRGRKEAVRGGVGQTRPALPGSALPTLTPSPCSALLCAD